MMNDMKKAIQEKGLERKCRFLVLGVLHWRLLMLYTDVGITNTFPTLK